MGIKSFSRARAIHVMLVYTGGCNGCDIEIVNSILSPRFDAEQYKVFLRPFQIRNWLWPQEVAL